MRGAIFTSEKFIFPCVVSKYNVLCWPMLHVFFDALACLCFPVSQRCVLGIRIRRCVSLFICCSRASTACVYVCRASAHAAETGPVFDAMRLLVSTVVATLVQGESREMANFYARDFLSQLHCKDTTFALRSTNFWATFLYVFQHLFSNRFMCARE
jgi:hypothetical protein